MNKHFWKNNETLNDDSSHRIDTRRNNDNSYSRYLSKVAVMPILCEKEGRFGATLRLRESLN